ncbi:MAG TPA: FtsQ-type POTRA domain-containing protein [Silvibacterium sp.]|nr:FtsQ-type POTRA domain-containing protein [Silvibacterium sp.]
MLVDDEPGLLRAASPARSRVEKEFLPNGFGERFPGRRASEEGTDVRVRRRAPVRKGVLPLWMKTRWGRIAILAITLVAIAAGVTAAMAVRSYFEHDWRFRIDSSDYIQTMGNSQLTRDDLLSVFGSDIGRNIFYIPLAERRVELEQIPWVEHATVMRILPNQLRISIRERTPEAFVRIGDRIKLVDGAGVILAMPPATMAARHFSFPVVTGIRPADALPVRAARMQIYERFVSALDASGEHLSSKLSEVDLSDPEDVRVTVPAKSSDLLLHFGDTNFLARYRIYERHLNEWEQQYPQLASADLRYENEVVLKMASEGSPATASATYSATPPAGTSSHAAVKAHRVATHSATVSSAHAAKKIVAGKRDHGRKKQAGRKRR